jgi:hypothetical protein
MLTHLADALTHLSYRQAISLAACVATLVVLVEPRNVTSQ